MKKKHYGLSHTLSKLLSGQSLARIQMNVALSNESISGVTADIGGGRAPDYFSYLTQASGTRVTPVDGALNGIDFETDRLPFEDGTLDTALMCNILEHIYDYRHLLSEVNRSLRKGGALVGFVPFWVGYHPDPRDYFRYTKEALVRMLSDAGFTNVHVREVGGGPFRANFNTLSLSIPRLLRPVVYIGYVLADEAMLALRPKARERYPLGYVFTATS